MDTSKKAMDIVTKNLNDSINKAMELNPDADAATILQKAIGISIDNFAEMFEWSEDRKAKFIDKWLDNYNEIKKQK